MINIDSHSLVTVPNTMMPPGSDKGDVPLGSSLNLGKIILGFVLNVRNYYPCLG